MLVWLVATVMFVCFASTKVFDESWMVFIYAVPASLTVLLIFNSLWGNKRLNYLIISVFTWTLLASIFLVILLASQYTDLLWTIFILGIPIQVSTILWSQLKRHERAARRQLKKERNVADNN